MNKITALTQYHNVLYHRVPVDVTMVPVVFIVYIFNMRSGTLQLGAFRVLVMNNGAFTSM